MQLQYKNSSAQRRALKNIMAGDALYFVPFDIDDKGRFFDTGFVALTKTHIAVFHGDEITQSVPLCDCEDIKSEAFIDCGVFCVTLNGEDTVLARFSMLHLVRFSYIARGARLLKSGDTHLLESLEPEQVCPKCGHVIPGTGSCPKCEGKKKSTKRIIGLCKPYVLRLSIISVLMLLSSGLALYQQKWQQLFIDNVLIPESGGLSDVALFIIVMVAFTAGTIGLRIFRSFLGVLLGAKISMDLRQKLFVKIQALSLSYQDKRKPGDLMNRVTGDTEQIRRFMTDVFSNLFSYLVTFIGALVIMLVMDWQLTLLSMLMMPAMLILNRIFRKRMHRMYRNQRRRNDTLNSQLQDVLQGIRAVKTFGKEDFEAQRFEKAAAENAKCEEENECFWAFFQPSLVFLLNMGTIIVLYLSGVKALSGNGFTVGETAQFIAYASMLFGPLGWFSSLPRMLLNMRISFSRIDDVMSNDPEIFDSKTAKDHNLDGVIEFKDVTFGYRNSEPVLNKISMRVEKGEMIGLVGESGAGKSTVINLIMRLYDVDEGEILFDGVNIKDIKSASLHSQIGVVLQENYLFAGTILDNIRFSNPGATPEDIIHAAKTAGAHDFIVKFPDGYNTLVGEKGQRLSGGERQRIAIARAVLGNPKLLILDEATSALDTESEFHIKRALERLCENRTTFAIAHRLSTLKNADRIMVIDDHKIAECGSHEELIKQGNIYKGLVDAQLEMHKIHHVAG